MTDIRTEESKAYLPSHEAMERGRRNQRLPIIAPPVDIVEDEKNITLLAEMPGVGIENLIIEVKEDKLYISGMVSHIQGEDEDPLSIEYAVGRYQRRFKLPVSVEPDFFDARLVDGLLTFKMKRRAKNAPVKIKIKTG